MRLSPLIPNTPRTVMGTKTSGVAERNRILKNAVTLTQRSDESLSDLSKVSGRLLGSFA